jgi:hypothetical protein
VAPAYAADIYRKSSCPPSKTGANSKWIGSSEMSKSLAGTLQVGRIVPIAGAGALLLVNFSLPEK